MNAAIIAVGDELLDGRVADLNTAFFASRLSSLGVPVAAGYLCGDGADEIASTLEAASHRADLLILAGGIGPTEDDRTREAVARFAKRELRESPAAWQSIQAWFAERGRETPASNRRQALFPEGATLLRNRAGTAPGFVLELRAGKRVLVLPGVPGEARLMFRAEVEPLLPVPELAVRQETLCFGGVSESKLGGLLADLLREGQEPRVGITSDWGLLSVTVRARAHEVGEAETALGATLARVRELGSRWLLGPGPNTLEGFLVARCVERDVSLALAESCTAGLVASRVGSVPGASSAFSLGLVTYGDQAKTDTLAVPSAVLATDGAVSAACARAMCEGLAERSKARLCGAITGIAGPTGGSTTKPVGLVWLAASLDGALVCEERRYGDVGRDRVQHRASSDLLLLLLRLLR